MKGSTDQGPMTPEEWDRSWNYTCPCPDPHCSRPGFPKGGKAAKAPTPPLPFPSIKGI
jgi:hypothetical protein